MSLGIAGSLEKYINETSGLAFANLDNIMTGFGALFGAGVGLYFVMTILQYMFSGKAAQLPIMDLFKRFFFLALVTIFAFSVGNYKEFVVNPVLAIPDDVAKLVSGKDQTTAQIIDAQLKGNFTKIFELWKTLNEMKIWNISFVLVLEIAAVTVIIILFGTAYLLLSFSYLMVAKILVNVLLLIGPIFIMMGFFSATREFFSKWIGQIFNYIFLVVLFTAVFTILDNVMAKVIGSAQSQAYLSSKGLEYDSIVIKFLFMYGLFTVVIKAVPALASAITGGIGISPFGSFSPLTNVLKSAGKGLGRGAGLLAGAGAKVAGNAAKTGWSKVTGGSNSVGKSKKLG